MPGSVLEVAALPNKNVHPRQHPFPEDDYEFAARGVLLAHLGRTAGSGVGNLCGFKRN